MKVCTSKSPCKILLVEDYSDHAQLAIENVRRYGDGGFEICLGRNLAEGKVIAKREGANLALALLDLTLPDSKGIDTLIELKKEIDDRVPIVVVTNMASEELEDLCFKHGAQEYVLKDEIIDGSRSLVRIMRHSVERWRYHLVASASQKALAELAEQEGLSTGDALRKIVEVKNDLSRLVVNGV